MNSKTKGEYFIQGGLASIPLIAGAIPFGLIFGTLSINSGLSVIQTMMLSALVFAGSSQFIAVGLFAAGASIPVILFTTFMINIRHFLYSATLVNSVAHLPQYWRAFLAFGLTDESFAVVKRFVDDNGVQKDGHWFYAGSIFFFYSAWNISTWLGVFFGSKFPNLENLGLDFAMYVTFIGIVASYLNANSMWLCMFCSGILSMVFVYFPHHLGLTAAAVCAMIVATVYENYGRAQ